MLAESIGAREFSQLQTTVPSEIPDSFLYVLKHEVEPETFFGTDDPTITISSKHLYDAHEIIPHLFKDGLHRAQLNIGPLGMTAGSLVMNVSCSTNWSDRRFVGPEAFQGEPFIRRFTAKSVARSITLAQYRVHEPYTSLCGKRP